MELSWTFAPRRPKNPSLFCFCFVLFCFFVYFFFQRNHNAGQLGFLQFLKERSLEIEYYQKSANVDRESSIAVF